MFDKLQFKYGLFHNNIVKFALDMPYEWVQRLTPITPVMAAYVMRSCWDEEAFPAVAADVLGISVKDFYKLFPEAEDFLKVTTKYMMWYSLNLGPFGDLDKSRNDKMLKIREHVRKNFCSNNLAGMVQLINEADKTKCCAGTKSIVDMLYEYIQNKPTLDAIYKALDKAEKDTFTKTDIAKILKLTCARFDVPVDDLVNILKELDE